MTTERPGLHITLDDLYIAYKKAKQEAFYEKTHFHAVVFTQYEQALHSNLKKLLKELNSTSISWFENSSFLGGYSYLPKSIDTSCWNNEGGHFCALHPIDDWRRKHDNTNRKADARFRLVITPTVNFQIISALWIMTAGYKYYRTIDKSVSYGNRIREMSAYNTTSALYETTINLDTPGIFVPYFSCYKDWREHGLSSMQKALEQKKTILAVTMDVEQFYHRLSPTFILDKGFLEKFSIQLSSPEETLTRKLLCAINHWYQGTPDYQSRPKGAIPVGLSASKIISNILMNEFDNAVCEKLKPIYYGRYVDDVFLVIENPQNIASAKETTTYLANQLAPLISVKQGNGRGNKEQPSLIMNLGYAKDSEVIFSGKKQKIFALSSSHGLDLIQSIKEQIRTQSSEYRLLPTLPESGNEMASRALLITPDATLQADALRKADAVSIRRLGLTLLIRDVEAYADDLEARQWLQLRHEFYELILRHGLTPKGFFDYFGHIPRVFGIMIASRDLIAAEALISQLLDVIEVLRQTTVQDDGTAQKFELCISNMGIALRQSGLQASTAIEDKINSELLRVFKKLKAFSSSLRISPSTKSLRKEVHQMLLSDWGRRPYKDYWYFSQKGDEIGPRVPRELKMRQRVKIRLIKKFVENFTTLKSPYWPSLAFPTRPLSFTEIGLVAPGVLENASLYKLAVMLLRGARVFADRGFGFQMEPDHIKSQPLYFLSPKRLSQKNFVAVTSYETTKTQWDKAARGIPDRSPLRYKNLNSVINKIIQEQDRPSYILFPELSIPRKWALRIANKLSQNNVSLISGVEYYRDRKSRKIRNDCLISLITNWPGYRTNVVIMQSKIAPAIGEIRELKKLLKRKNPTFYKPKSPLNTPHVYVHGDFCFSVVICSDLTNISHRNLLRGHIDCLFASEWNQDTKTFSPLVESTANDLHCYVVQANNRQYGDSRIRAPHVADYMRDVVQVKGGLNDYYVIGQVNQKKLRSEQKNKRGTKTFKPTPIGYSMSAGRKK